MREQSRERGKRHVETIPGAAEHKPLAEGSAVQPPKSRWLEPSRSLVALISALVALVVSIPTGVYTVWPALSPDPKEKVGATLETLAFDQNVTYQQYLARRPRHHEDGAALDRNGNVFYIRAMVEGFKREELRVRWFTYEATNSVRITRLGSTAALEEIFRPQAPVNTQIAQVWVPTPPNTGDYFVRFELYASGNVLLSFLDSPTFHVEQA